MSARGPLARNEFKIAPALASQDLTDQKCLRRIDSARWLMAIAKRARDGLGVVSAGRLPSEWPRMP